METPYPEGILPQSLYSYILTSYCHPQISILNTILLEKIEVFGSEMTSMLEISKTWIDMRQTVEASLTFATIKPGCIPYVDVPAYFALSEPSLQMEVTFHDL